jgi:hypothetical protein
MNMTEYPILHIEGTALLFVFYISQSLFNNEHNSYAEISAKRS